MSLNNKNIRNRQRKREIIRKRGTKERQPEKKIENDKNGGRQTEREGDVEKEIRQTEKERQSDRKRSISCLPVELSLQKEVGGSYRNREKQLKYICSQRQKDGDRGNERKRWKIYIRTETLTKSHDIHRKAIQKNNWTGSFMKN